MQRPPTVPMSVCMSLCDLASGTVRYKSYLRKVIQHDNQLTGTHAAIKLYPLCTYFLTDADEVRCIKCPRNSVEKEWIFMKICAVEAVLDWRVWMKFCPNCVNFPSCLDKVRYRNCLQKFIAWLWVTWKSAQWEKWFTVGLSGLCTFCYDVEWKTAQAVSDVFVSINEITLHVYRETKWYFQIKHPLVTCVYSVKGVRSSLFVVLVNFVP